MEIQQAKIWNFSDTYFFMPPRELINEVLKARNIELSKLAERTGYEERTLRRVMRGEIPMSQKLERLLRRDLPGRVPKMEGAPRIAEEEPSSGPVHSLKNQPPVRRIPLIGWAAAGEALDCEDIVEWDDFLAIETLATRAIAVRVRGDSMQPNIIDGDMVVLNCGERPQNGDVVVARLKDEGVVCKRFQIIDPRQRLFRLISANADYVPMERTEDQFVWIYPVEKLVRNMRR